MNISLDRMNAHWVRYSDYEWKTDKEKKLYLTPVKDAEPEIYDPMKEYEAIVVCVMNIGRLCMGKKPDEEIQAAIRDFALKYGLLGLMTALPTTPTFMDYEAVYLPKNHFIKAETMNTLEYVALFFPFGGIDLKKRGLNSLWNIEGDRSMMALAMTMSDKPMAVNMGFQREYAERYDWMKQQFVDWVFTLTTSDLYYEDYDLLDEDIRNLYRQAMAAFDGIAPTYHIALLEKPTIIWDFHSLLLGIQMMFSFMLTDEKTPLRLCRHCMKVFVASRPSNQFCSPECKNRHNVYKNRAKKKENE